MRGTHPFPFPSLLVSMSMHSVEPKEEKTGILQYMLKDLFIKTELRLTNKN